MRGVRGAAILSGILLTLAAPPSPLPLLVLAALAPWAAAVGALPPGAEGRRAALRSGALLFAVHWGLVLLWVLRLAPRVGLWTVPAWLGQVGLLALLGAGVGALLHRLADRVGLVAAVALAWVVGEWVRGTALGPLAFPWMGVVVPLAAIPELVQGMAWVGERGLALGVGGVNGAVAAWLAARWRGARDVPAAALAAGVAVVGVAVVGGLRLRTMEPVGVLGARVVQPAVPLAVKRGPPDLALQRSLEAVEALLGERPGARGEPASTGDRPGAESPVDVVVLPETAVPAVLDAPGAVALRERVQGWARGQGAPLLVGAYGSAPDGRRTNAVFRVPADSGGSWTRVDKVRLVPGVEWSPGSADGLVGAPAPRLLEVAGVGVGALVCIESAGPEPARTLRRMGADVLVNVTNDAWLGEEPWWTRTAAFRQHPAHLALRAVATGAGALRVGNNGLTTVVDPGGRQRVVLPPHRPGIATVTVTSLPGPTLFTRTGDLAGPLAAVVALLVVLLPGSRRQTKG